MTTTVLLQRDPTRSAYFRLELSLAWEPLDAKWTVRIEQHGTGSRGVTVATLRTDGVIDATEMHELLGVLDTRAHLMLSRLLDVQQVLF